MPHDSAHSLQETLEWEGIWCPCGVQQHGIYVQSYIKEVPNCSLVLKSNDVEWLLFTALNSPSQTKIIAQPAGNKPWSVPLPEFFTVTV